MFQGVTEIGVAVTDLEATAELYKSVLGASVSGIVAINKYEMQMRICRIGNVNFKLMEPLTQDGIIRRFIQKCGQGLHHITLKVTDLDKALDWMKQSNVKMIDETPKAFGNTRFAFVHPKSFEGVMFELSEGQYDWFENK